MNILENTPVCQSSPAINSESIMRFQKKFKFKVYYTRRITEESSYLNSVEEIFYLNSMEEIFYLNSMEESFNLNSMKESL